MKIIVLFLLIFIPSTFVLAQERDIWLNFGLQIGSYGDGPSLGIHAYAKKYYSEHFVGGLNVEYAVFAGEENPFSIVPALYHYFPSSNSQHFFVGWGTGLYIVDAIPTIGLKPLMGYSFKPSFEISMEYNLILGFPSNYLALKTSLGLKLDGIEENKTKLKKDIRINFGFHYNLPQRWFNSNLSSSDNRNVGTGVHLYPKWYYSQKLAFGINLEYGYVETKESAIFQSIGGKRCYYRKHNCVVFCPDG